MKTFKINLTSNFEPYNINLAIGNFDGIHIGHQRLIKDLVTNSKKMNLKSAIMTFNPHPRQFFTNNYKNFNIIDEDDKIELLRKLDVDYYISFEFDSSLASLTPEKFILEVLVNKLKIKNITVGYDFKFGKDRKGNNNLLKKFSSKYKYKVLIIDRIMNKQDLLPYSSTYIREHISKGDFKKVSLMLGRNWSLSGKVIYGDQRASKINFPTANIVPKDLINPKMGVYAIRAKYLGDYYDGIANYGVRPTIKGEKLLLEAHLFKFNENIYGKDLTVEFLAFIREEKKFDDFSALTIQIQKDIEIAKKYHSKN